MLLSRHPDGLRGVLALPSTQEGAQHTLSLCACFSPGLGKLEGVVSREGGLLRALISTGFSCNPLPRLPPSPSLRQYAFVCLWGYHQEKNGFRL